MENKGNQMLSTEQRAQVLIDALPHIQMYNDKIVVIKYGGNAMTNEELKEAVMSDIVLLNLVGVKTVLVHGGGPEINDMLKRVGIESKFINGLRYTDADTVDIVKMVLAGKVNKELVSHLTQNGGRALGMCGIDGNMIVCHKIESDVDLGYVGEIDRVNTKVILDALEKGYIPVVSTVACDESGQTYNINADTAAARIAAELKAENLILMTDIVGLLKDKDDDSTLISSVHVSHVPFMKKQGIISGGMIPKVECCVEA
ncbi:MAG: acetylglutamate kinase, partial [Huintestinicola sp.]